jgi:hypothetical protein
MSTRRKLLLAALTAWPPIYMLLFFAWIVVTFATSDDGSPAGPGFGVVLGFHLATILLSLALLVVYVRHALRSGRVPTDQRLLWVVILCLGNAIAMPIYWWLFVWNDGDRHPQAHPTMTGSR